MNRRGKQLSEKQNKLLEFLRKNSGKHVTEAQLLKETGYMQRSFRVMLGNGRYDPYLERLPNDRINVVAAKDLDEREFHRQVSQTAVHQEFGAGLHHPLARKLVQKARDNFILALELFNRPSLENRLDAFAQLFCTAWEQLLKAELLDSRGEESVFLPKKKGRRRETISLQKCVEKILPDNKDSVRRNLERIAELRHEATHLLMKETAAPISQLFQAGVINFATRFRKIIGEPLLPESSGLLSLVGPDNCTNAVDLKQLYGEITASEISSLKSDLEKEIGAVEDSKFAIPVSYRLVLTKHEVDGDISLTVASGADSTCSVVEKPVALTKKYPFFTNEAIARVSEMVNKKFTSNDFQAVLFNQGWKCGDNKFHSYEKKFKRHCYSEECIDRIVQLISSNEDYLEKVRTKLRNEKKRNRNRSLP